MKRQLGFAVLFGTALAAVSVIRAAESQQPAWAYAIPQASLPGAPPPSAVRSDGRLFGLPGTDRKFTSNQIRGRSDTRGRIAPADWSG